MSAPRSTLTTLLLAALALALAACATAPAAVDHTPPPRKALDAKSGLEAGPRY